MLCLILVIFLTEVSVFTLFLFRRFAVSLSITSQEGCFKDVAGIASACAETPLRT